MDKFDNGCPISNFNYILERRKKEEKKVEKKKRR